MNRKDLVVCGEKAFRELEMSAVTHVDKLRADRVWTAFRALDDEHAALREKLDTLLANHRRRLEEIPKEHPSAHAPGRRLLELQSHVSFHNAVQALVDDSNTGVLGGMGLAHVRRALELCAPHLREFEPARFDAEGTKPSTSSLLKHASWMLPEAIKLVEERRLGKAMRWLGFVQGVLWSTWRCTIDELKNMNKPQ